MVVEISNCNLSHLLCYVFRTAQLGPGNRWKCGRKQPPSVVISGVNFTGPPHSICDMRFLYGVRTY